MKRRRNGPHERGTSEEEKEKMLGWVPLSMGRGKKTIWEGEEKAEGLKRGIIMAGLRKKEKMFEKEGLRKRDFLPKRDFSILSRKRGKTGTKS